MGAKCVFPFKYAGTTYTSCTTTGNNPSWCYTKVDSQGNGVQGMYGDCGTSPACNGATTTTTTTTTTSTTTTTTTTTVAVDAACLADCEAACAAPTTSTTTTTTTTTTTP